VKLKDMDSAFFLRGDALGRLNDLVSAEVCRVASIRGAQPEKARSHRREEVTERHV